MKNGTYYVVGNGLLYIVQAGVTSVPIPWEKGRKYHSKINSFAVL